MIDAHEENKERMMITTNCEKKFYFEYRQRTDSDENANLRGNTDYLRVLVKHKGRTARHADFETTEGLCADSFTD